MNRAESLSTIEEQSPSNYELVVASEDTNNQESSQNQWDDQEYDFPSLEVKVKEDVDQPPGVDYDVPSVRVDDECDNSQPFEAKIADAPNFLTSPSDPKGFSKLPAKISPIDIKRQLSFNRVKTNFKPRVLFFQK